MDGSVSKASERSIVVTTDRSRLDLDMIHGFLTTAYWSRGIPRDGVREAMDASVYRGRIRANVAIQTILMGGGDHRISVTYRGSTE